MTSVVGILNKRGVALAADSAVTRSKRDKKGDKYTKNGNKMLRLNDIVPICVMITGDADFLYNPWDVVIRRYRQERGKIIQPTVEAAINDLFEYLSANHMFWDIAVVDKHVSDEIEHVFDIAIKLCEQEGKRKPDGSLQRPIAFKKAFLKALKKISDYQMKLGICIQFKDYTLADFHKNYGALVESFLESKANPNSYRIKDPIPLEILEEVHEEFEKAVMIMLTTYNQTFTQLIFSGFGENEEYPSLVPVWVYEGFDFKINYHIETEKVLHISDEKPAAICPFALDDVSKSILGGIHERWAAFADVSLKDFFNSFNSDLLSPKEGLPDIDMSVIWNLEDVESEDLLRSYENGLKRIFDSNLHQWEKNLVNYDLKSMASLAESLIDLTGFHRILNFEQEVVGGPVDLATISKTDGFSWLNRKSWYHHKDTDGMHGKFGI